MTSIESDSALKSRRGVDGIREYHQDTFDIPCMVSNEGKR